MRWKRAQPGQRERERERELQLAVEAEREAHIVDLLHVLGADERGETIIPPIIPQESPGERETRLKRLARERKRMTGQTRWCRCNGSGVYDYDQDGDPYCRNCGGPVAEVPRSRERGYDGRHAAIMREVWTVITGDVA